MVNIHDTSGPLGISSYALSTVFAFAGIQLKMASNMISNTGRAFLCSNNIIEMYQKGTTSFYENGMVNAYHSYVTQTTSPFIFLPKFYQI